MITLKIKEWNKIRKQIKEDYKSKPSVLAIRSVMKRELGFTTRYHRQWEAKVGFIETMCLDFYNDSSKSYFILKYLDRD